nr:hypothetical protein [Streptomyces longwoodensis]
MHVSRLISRCCGRLRDEILRDEILGDDVLPEGVPRSEGVPGDVLLERAGRDRAVRGTA